ncbi:hypothetical protein [Rhizobium oryzihabitans]|uniref:hypothetical protein n=1 Tax=Rhizobium oryzihabitans TaxID=2267833 RepID=UPI00403540AD
METVTIESPSDFAQWAIERATAIIAEQGGNLAMAALGGDDSRVAESANALGQAIVDALLEVLDGLVPQE